MISATSAIIREAFPAACSSASRLCFKGEDVRPFDHESTSYLRRLQASPFDQSPNGLPTDSLESRCLGLGNPVGIVHGIK